MEFLHVEVIFCAHAISLPCSPNLRTKDEVKEAHKEIKYCIERIWKSIK